MELALVTVEKITEMFLIMLAGATAFRWKIMDSAANKRMSGMLLKIISPAMLFMAYQIEYESERLRGLLIIMVLSIASFVWTIFLVNLLLPLKKREDEAVEQMAAIYANCGFIGIPLINGILGMEGVFYLTAYITTLNLIIWSHGQAIMRGTMEAKMAMKNFIQPATVAIGLGIVFFLFRIRLPEILASPLKMVGDMNTPLAMLVAGCSLAEGNLLAALKKARAYYISFIKLILIPGVSILFLSLVPVPQIYRMTIVIAIACPTAATCSMFALQYNKNSNYASELFIITTVLSLVTIPFTVLLAGWML